MLVLSGEMGLFQDLFAPHREAKASDLADPSSAAQDGGARDRAGSLAVSRIAADSGDIHDRDGGTERTTCGIRIVAQAGVQPGAVDQCAAYIEAEIGHNAYAQKQLADKRTTLVIIPANEHMTDVPQFRALAGGHTPDGRGWEDVRGSGGYSASDGTFALAVSEENLVSVQSMFRGYGPGYSVGMHEFAHTIENAAMTHEQRARVVELYNARHALAQKQGTWQGLFTDEYASTDEEEYFAQCTDCYFGKNQGEGANGPDWLHEHDPDMFAFLVSMYADAHDGRGKDEGPTAPSSGVQSA